MSIRARGWVLGAVLAWGTGPCWSDEAPADTHLVESFTTVGASPWRDKGAYTPAIVSATKDLAHVAIMVPKPEAMWIDGKRGPAFDLIRTRSAVDDQDCIWSNTGRYAYAGVRSGKKFLVVDGVEAGPYDDVDPDTFLWDASGKRFAGVVTVGPASHVWSDGTLGPAFQSVWGDTLTFGPDGASLAYAAAKNGRAVLVVNGAVKEAAGSQDLQSVSEAAVSSDGAHLALVVTTEGGQACLVNGVASKTYPVVSGLQRIPGRGTFAFHAGERSGGGDVHRWVVADTELPAGAGIGRIFFSPDGAHHAYVLRELGKSPVVLLDGKPLVVEGAVLTEIRQTTLLFSPDGTRLACVAEGGGWRVVVDGKASPPIAGGGVDSLLFSPDSKHLAFRAFRDESVGNRKVCAIYLDGVERTTTLSERDWPHAFSPDSSALAHVVQMPDWTRRIEVVPVAAGDPLRARTPLDHEVWPELAFPDVRTVRYLAVRGDDIVRAEARWTPR